jgi:hypothetical protein
MTVGRKQIGKEAITIVEVDSSISNDLIGKISKIEGVTKVKNVSL